MKYIHYIKVLASTFYIKILLLQILCTVRSFGFFLFYFVLSVESAHQNMVPLHNMIGNIIKIIKPPISK